MSGEKVSPTVVDEFDSSELFEKFLSLQNNSKFPKEIEYLGYTVDFSQTKENIRKIEVFNKSKDSSDRKVKLLKENLKSIYEQLNELLNLMEFNGSSDPEINKKVNLLYYLVHNQADYAICLIDDPKKDSQYINDIRKLIDFGKEYTSEKFCKYLIYRIHTCRGQGTSDPKDKERLHKAWHSFILKEYEGIEKDPYVEFKNHFDTQGSLNKLNTDFASLKMQYEHLLERYINAEFNNPDSSIAKLNREEHVFYKKMKEKVEEIKKSFEGNSLDYTDFNDKVHKLYILDQLVDDFAGKMPEIFGIKESDGKFGEKEDDKFWKKKDGIFYINEIEGKVSGELKELLITEIDELSKNLKNEINGYHKLFIGEEIDNQAKFLEDLSYNPGLLGIMFDKFDAFLKLSRNREEDPSYTLKEINDILLGRNLKGILGQLKEILEQDSYSEYTQKKESLEKKLEIAKKLVNIKDKYIYIQRFALGLGMVLGIAVIAVASFYLGPIIASAVVGVSVLMATVVVAAVAGVIMAGVFIRSSTAIKDSYKNDFTEMCSEFRELDGFVAGLDSSEFSEASAFDAESINSSVARTELSLAEGSQSALSVGSGLSPAVVGSLSASPVLDSDSEDQRFNMPENVKFVQMGLSNKRTLLEEGLEQAVNDIDGKVSDTKKAVLANKYSNTPSGSISSRLPPPPSVNLE